MSEQSPPSETSVLAPSSDLDPVSPESFHSDSNHSKDTENVKSNEADDEADTPANGNGEEENLQEENSATADEPIEPMDVDGSDIPDEKDAAIDSTEDAGANDADIDDNERSVETDTAAGDVEMNDNEIAAEQNDTTQEAKSSDAAEPSAPDDSIMEHDPEQINCSEMDETQKTNKSVSEDPFDALRATESHTPLPNDTLNVSNASAGDAANADADDSVNADDSLADDGNDGDAGDVDGNDADDNDGDGNDGDGNDGDGNDGDGNDADGNEGDDHDDVSAATSVNGDTATEAVDDIEEGKGVDEALSLLPDEEREISEADKERAILAKEAAENETEETEDEVAADVMDVHDDTEADPTDKVNEAATELDEQDGTAVAGESITDLQRSLKENEIRELNIEEYEEQSCAMCNKSQLCKYALLTKSPSVDEGDATATEKIQYICELECVTEFRKENESYTLTARKVSINLIIDTPEKCQQCEEDKNCKYRIINDSGLVTFVCSDECVGQLVNSNPEKYVVKRKRYLIEELNAETEIDERCLQCTEEKKCKFTFKHDNDDLYVCQSSCLNLLMTEQPDRFRTRRQSVRVRDLPRRAPSERLVVNDASTVDAPIPPAGGDGDKIVARTEEEIKMAQIDREASFIRRCAQCFSEINISPQSLQWETMDFCNESCLGQYQTSIGAACTSCQNAVGVSSLGKYCVRFGFEVRQFCRSGCLDVYKKGLKVCSHCQNDVSKNGGFLAPINGQFKDFCGKRCMQQYEQICFPKKKPPSALCAVCNNVNPVKMEVIINSTTHSFCSKPCFSAFQFVNNIFPDSCTMCKKYFERKSIDSYTIYNDKQTQMFCTKICMNIFIITNRQIAPCQWCKVKKYNFDMIQRNSQNMIYCSLNCLTMCEVSMNAISMKQQPCDKCSTMTTPQYHLTMSDASVRNFCTYQCVMSFQSQFSRKPITLDSEQQAADPVPTGLPKRIKPGQTPPKAAAAPPPSKTQSRGRPTRQAASKNTTTVLVAKGTAAARNAPKTNNLIISCVTSLAPSTRSGRRGATPVNSLDKILQPVVELEPLPPMLLQKSARSLEDHSPSSVQTRVETKTQVVTVPPMPKRVSNATTMCRPAVLSKGITCKPQQCTIGCQTDSYLEKKMVIPIPVPIYMPSPMQMYTLPMPIPVPIPLPIPIPIFIPTTRNSANGIMKEIKKIQDKMPTDPFEAELLMMAEMVAGENRKKEESDSGTDDDNNDDDFGGDGGIGESNAFGEDMLQMALKMATEYDEPAVDLESAMTASTITPNSHPSLNAGNDGLLSHHQLLLLEQQRQAIIPPQNNTGRKRGPPARNTRAPAAKRGRKAHVPSPPPVPEPPREVEKADANMCLKFTFGVNAWKQWVMTKNADLEKSTLRRKPFKSELLQMTADELNYSLCLFVKEVRKPNGSEYAPDTIYYLVLGIQQYLYENGRIDNIFTDPYYERFTDCLDEVAKKFSVLYNDSQYIVTRVEEEHLWECKQLGAHSPHVLLSTLMFFNTKHFNLTSVEEHMQLSFSHIMKHWKRNPNQGSAKVPGSRNVLLRFYPPQNAQDSTGRKKKVYEQQENEENPLRCPVKLYEFYLSKCPESVKTRNDVFYLLPERSCVPDSPVWYSTQALGREALSKMLHRVKMVKEINIALLTS